MTSTLLKESRRAHANESAGLADDVAARIDAWATEQAKAAPRLSEEQLEILHDLFMA